MVREYYRARLDQLDELEGQGYRLIAADTYQDRQLALLLVRYPWTRDDGPGGDETGGVE